jgi:PAS domain S-box-containing protein
MVTISADRMKFRIDNKIVFALVVSVALFGLYAIFNSTRNQSNLMLSEHLERTNILMRDLENLQHDAERIDFGVEEYSYHQFREALDRFRKDSTETAAIIGRLNAYGRAHSAFSDSIFLITQHYEIWMNNASTIMNLVNDSMPASKVQRMSPEMSESILSLLSNEILGLEEMGRASLRVTESEQQRLSNSTYKLNILFSLLCIIIVFAVFILLQRESNKRHELEEKLKDYNQVLHAELQEKTKELSVVFDRITDGYFILNTEGKCTYVNAQGAMILGKSKGEILGKKYSELYKPQTNLAPSLQFGNVMNTKLNSHSQVFDLMSQKWLDFYAYPFESGMSIFIRDVTDLYESRENLIRSNEKFKVVNEQLRNLSEYLHKAREEERTFIAREIHDELGQILTGIKLDLSWLKTKSPQMADELSARLIAAIDLTNVAINSVKRIATSLRPVVLDDFGLTAAIEWLCLQFSQKNSVSLKLNLETGESIFPKDLSTTVFRICQEALTNISRHSKASEVVVEMKLGKKELILIIRDNGIGLNNETKSDSLGIIGMRERAESLGGELQITNNEKEGVTLELRVPYD